MRRQTPTPPRGQVPAAVAHGLIGTASSSLAAAAQPKPFSPAMMSTRPSRGFGTFASNVRPGESAHGFSTAVTALTARRATVRPIMQPWRGA